MQDKKTYGQIIAEHKAKNLIQEDDIREYTKAMEPDIIANIERIIEESKDNDLYKNRDFYIVMINKIEHIGRTPRFIVLARRSCPTPTYKQSVWKYHHESGSLEYLWHLPGMLRYYDILKNSQEYLQVKELHNMARFVLMDNRGELLEWVKKENGEKIDALITMNEVII